jgi:alkylation response protein AidB-like acyl-CoA dehydrogenase
MGRAVRDGVSGFLAKHHDLSRTRDLRGRAPGYDQRTWEAFTADGWLRAGLPEAIGGAGLGAEASAEIAGLFGAQLVPEPYVASGVLAPLVLAQAPATQARDLLLEQAASGNIRIALAWQEAVGQIDPGCGGATTIAGGQLTGHKVFVAGAVGADVLLVTAENTAGELVLVPVAAGAPGLQVTPVDQVDGGFAADVALDCAVGEADALPLDAACLEHAIDQARLALAAQLTGLARRALQITLDYAATRRQFDQPIGAFQVLQHRLVNLAIDVRLAEILVDRAVALQQSAGASFAAAVALAKAQAADAAVAVAQDAVQIHGGIGYTDECDIGLYLAAALRLAPWLGAPRPLRLRASRLAAAGAQVEAEEPSPFRMSIRRWLAKKCPDSIRRPIDRLQGAEHREWHRIRYEHGLIAPGWPQEHGGMALSVDEQIVMLEELERHQVARVFDMGISMLGPTLMKFGSAVQKAYYLPRALSGEHIWCQGYSEPGAGSDLASLRTRAVRDGDTYVVTGQKIWTSNAHNATHCFVLARTSTEGRKQEGISFLMVDLQTPGIRIRPIRNLAGGLEFCEVFYDGVRVPAGNLVGEEGQGWTIAKSLLGFERLAVGSPAPARLAVDTYRRAARNLGLASDPLVQNELAGLEADLEALTGLFRASVEAMGREEIVETDLSVLKIVASEVFQSACEKLMGIAGEFGAAGRMRTDQGELDLRQLYMVSRPATIYGGSSEVHRNILSRQWLNLPAR